MDEIRKYTDAEALAAFVARMNQKAAEIGMKNSLFRDPAGIDNLSTAHDLLRLLVCADRYRALDNVWNAPEEELMVMGDMPRRQLVESTVVKPQLETHYHIIGGKTGTLPRYNARNLAVILEIPGRRERLAVVELYADGLNSEPNNRFEAVRQIADAALQKLQDPCTDLSRTEICCKAAAACLIPAAGAAVGEDLPLLFAKNAEEQLVPASVSKVLTAVCMMDVVDSLCETYDYRQFDTEIGGFYAEDFLPGDEMTFHQGLYAMLLPSSNVSAMAIARTVGQRLLKE